MLNLDQYQAAFKALSHQVRLKLYEYIYEESLFCDLGEEKPLARNTIGDLAKLINLSESTVAHHINILRSAQLISGKRFRNSVYLFPELRFFKVLAEAETKISVRTEIITKPLELQTVVELQKFREATEFVELHGFNLVGPTGLKGSEGSLRYQLVSRRNSSQRLDATFVPQEGKIFLARLDTKENEKAEIKVSELYRKFFAI